MQLIQTELTLGQMDDEELAQVLGSLATNGTNREQLLSEISRFRNLAMENIKSVENDVKKCAKHAAQKEKCQFKSFKTTPFRRTAITPFLNTEACHFDQWKLLPAKQKRCSSRNLQLRSWKRKNIHVVQCVEVRRLPIFHGTRRIPYTSRWERLVEMSESETSREETRGGWRITIRSSSLFVKDPPRRQVRAEGKAAASRSLQNFSGLDGEREKWVNTREHVDWPFGRSGAHDYAQLTNFEHLRVNQSNYHLKMSTAGSEVNDHRCDS
ncbi:unnamed protein product, partial [Nesidiocoris tenuis]